MSTLYFIVQQTMLFAVPLLVVSLGGLFSEKSGISNIALEGIMIIGAFAGVVTVNALSGSTAPQLLLLIAIAAAGIAGGLYSTLHAWASVRLKADQTISGTALNLFAPAFCVFTARAVYGVRQVAFGDVFHIDKVPLLGDIPVLGELLFTNCYLSTYIGIVLLAAARFVLKRMRFGMRLSACGENPSAAASVGISVAKMRWIGVTLSGVFGGIGGVIFVIPTSTTFSATVAGYGFLALAVLILGQWEPVKILTASFFFGLLKAISSSYSGIPFLAKLPVASEFYKMIPYVLTLVVLALSSGASRAPKALGVVYEDGGRTGSVGRRTVIGAITAAVLAAAMVVTAVSPAAEKKKNAVSAGYGAEIALVIESNGSVDDKGYTQSIWDGIVQYTDEANLTRKYYQSKDDSLESFKKCIEIAAKGNAEVIVAGSNTFEAAVGTEQERFPDRVFILFDGEPRDPDTGEVRYASNTIAVSFAEEQAGFLAGYAIVRDGFRKLGFVGGMSVPAVIKYGYGFIAGCDCAAQELGLAPGEVELKYHYAGTFVPNPETQAMASAWYHSGVEAIFACAGGAGDSVVKAAENAGKYVIQVDQDKSQESETVITSAVKDMSYALKVIFDAYQKGELQTGRSMCLSAEQSCVGLPMETSRFRSFSEADYEKIYARLASGEIAIPAQADAASPQEIGSERIALTVVK